MKQGERINKKHIMWFSLSSFLAQRRKATMFFPIGGNGSIIYTKTFNLLFSRKSYRHRDYLKVKQESHTSPKKPLPMNQLASPVVEGGAPGA